MNNKNILFINSNQKYWGTWTNFNIKFNNPIEIKKYIKLNFALIPHTAYTITWNETITFIIAGITHIINIWPACFGITQLITYINQQITNWGLNNSNYYVTYSTNTFKVWITSLSVPYGEITFSWNIKTILGFSENSYNWLTSSLTSENCVKFNVYNVLFVSLDKINNINIVSWNNLLSSFIVPILCDPGSYVTYNNDSYLESTNTIYCNTTFSNLNVWIKSENNLIFNNNNNDLILIFEYC